MRPKQRALLSFSILVAGLLTGGLVARIGDYWEQVGIAVVALSAATGFLMAARLRCQACGFQLSKKFPVGPLILLFMAKEKCPSCGDVLQ